MRFAGIACLVLLGADLALAQTVPALAEPPACVAGTDRTNLTQQRQALSTLRDELRARISSHDSTCRNVPVNSGQASTCSAQQARLSTERDLHIEATNVFNSSLTAAQTACGGSNLPMLVARVRGTVFIETASGRSRMTQSTPVPPNARVVTENNSAIELQLSSGERIQIGPNSTFIFGTAEPSLLAGVMRLVHACIRGTACLKRAERVTTPTAVAGVRGTDFLLETGTSGTTVSVFEGTVDVTGVGSTGPVTLKEGQRIQVDGQGRVGAAAPLGNTSRPTWFN